MTDAECKAIEQKSVEKVRKALKTLTSGEIYDGKMSKFLNQAGYDALEEIEGLDLFWICDPLIKLAKKGEWIKDNIGICCSVCKKHLDVETPFCPLCGADMRKGGTE